MSVLDDLLPEQLARIKIDKQLTEAGWDIVTREEYVPFHAQAAKEALMTGTTESDYLLFVDNKAIAVVEAKREENNLGDIVAEQAENYSRTPRNWYGLWFDDMIPLVYLANGKKIYFKNMLDPDSEYVELSKMHSPKKMLNLIGAQSNLGALPRIDRSGLRDCQYRAESEFENSLRNGKKKALAVLATGSGKTYLACLASYRLLNYTPVDRVLFLVDRNNLAKQTKNEFSTFDKTENGMTLNTLYRINRLVKQDDINGDVVISTIQKLFAVLTGNNLIDDGDEDESEDYFKEEPENEPEVELGDNLKLPQDYFKFIVVDECHRSIYGKWRSVLNYFKDAVVLGLTATPTEEAYAFFNKNVVEKYTYEDSVLDGVNVPFRIFDIETRRTVQGGEIDANSPITEVSRRTQTEKEITTSNTVIYTNDALDRSVYDRGQIRQVLMTYRDAIYTDLYPEREEKWEYIPKTLIFAKNDKHADEIVKAAKEVFGEKFTNNEVPEGFVQKITYSAGDSNQLISNLNYEKNFRIAVTVTLVATGTDVKPLEVVLFMADVKSDVLYTQMKGRGCRTLNDDKLKEVTPNAESKECFYIVDAVGVTKGEKTIPRTSPTSKKKMSLKDLLEHLSHGEVSNENLTLLRDYCSLITNRYKNNPLFSRHLDEFINKFGYSPVFISEQIQTAFTSGTLPPYESPSADNSVRMSVISKLIYDNNAKSKLLELRSGYYVFAPDTPDETIYSGFSYEAAKTFIENFEKCLIDHKDTIEALRIIYNSEDKLITYSMLTELKDMLLSENRQYNPYFVWRNYKRLDTEGNVADLDQRRNINALTNLIQLARYAFKKDSRLVSLYGLFAQRFNLYVGSTNHNLSETQVDLMRKIAEYIVNDGAISTEELNSVDAELWRYGIKEFGMNMNMFAAEMQMLSKYVIGAA